MEICGRVRSSGQPDCICRLSKGHSRTHRYTYPDDWKGTAPAVENPKASEAVEHPSHYGGDKVYETIKVIMAWGLGFNLGNAVKYISRAGKKDPTKQVEDLEKARFYLDYEIALLKGERTV
jgi:hypothetical protein